MTTEISMDVREHYQQHGYAILHNLIPKPLIDNVLTFYTRDIVRSPLPFFRQSTYSYSKNELNEFEYVKESFLDIHDYRKYPEFSHSVREILCGSKMQEALKQLLGDDSNLVQSMLFDANTNTFPHQEWWYLDTVPNGNLVIAWIALEDIDERAGRFYVLPQTPDNLDFHSDRPDISHQEWANRIKAYVETHQHEIQAPALKQGDVLFLNSKTIHGSLPTIDPQFSRKSITAHYIPSTYEFGNLFRHKSITYKTYNNIRCYSAHPEYSALNQLNFKLNYFLRSSPVLKPIRQARATFDDKLKSFNLK
jgi:phytanoyl-CoA hydroxylase